MKPLQKQIACVVVLLLMPGLIFGQKKLSDWVTVEKLKPGTKVIVSTKKGREFIGEKRQSTDDTIFIEVALPVSGSRVISLPREEIAEVRERKSRRMLPLIGAAIGVGAGIAIGSTADHPGSDDPGLGKAIGGGLGGVIGGAAGSLFMRKTKTVYVAP